jgi:uncharacterized protein YdeI (YjbR/CyaY-like superfamily)
MHLSEKLMKNTNAILTKRSVEEDKLLYLPNRGEWREWLEKHHQTEKEVWLVFYKKQTGKPRIAYNDAVEEALCFGWIDSTVKSVDEDRFAQRFSVRNLKVPYSQANKERLKRLIQQGKVIDAVLSSLPVLEEDQFLIPPDILEAIKVSSKAWENFQRFSPSYIRIRIAFINGARKRPQEFTKRLRFFIEMTEKNKQFGFGGIEKYY